jgi:xylulokinase
LGFLTVDDIPERVKIARIYTPNPQNRQIYDELFAEFEDIYKREKKFYARINRSR